MKEYIKPEVEVIDFTTEVIATLIGSGVEEFPW